MRVGVLIASVAVVGLCGSLRAQEAAPAYVIPADTPAHIRRAVESSERSDEHRARDANRKPAETLAASGVQPGDHIIELAALGQYFTTMLVEAVGPAGRVDMFDMPYTERFGGPASRQFDAEHDNAEFHQVHFNDAQFPSNVDAVWNVLFYHDMQPQGVDIAALNRKLFAALKPGGIYLVIDHKAEDGSGWRDAESLHRIAADTLKAEVLAAGFELALDSDLLAHPADDRKAMVFAPGTRGLTDQAFFIFRKPN